MVDIMRAVNIGLTNMLNASSFLSGAAAVAIAIAAIGGALLAIGATLAVSYGGFLALRTAFQAAIVEGVIFKGTLGGVIASLFGLVPAQRAAAVGFNTIEAGAIGARGGIMGMIFSLKTLKLALASTGIGLVALAIGYVAEALMNLDQPTEEAVVSLNLLRTQTKNTKEALSPLTSEIEAFITEILKAPSATTDFNNSMFALGQSVLKNGKYFGDATQAGRENLSAFRGTLVAMFAASAGSEQVYGNSLIAYRDHLASIGMLTAQMRNEIERTLLGINFSLDPSAAISGTKAYEEGFKKVTSSAGTAKTALEKLDDILNKVFKRYDATSGMMDSLDALGTSIAKNGKAFGYGTAGMRDNLKALQDTISAFKTSSNGNLSVFAGNLVNLRASLVKLGVSGGTAMSLIDSALASVKTKGKRSAKELSQIYGAINNALVTEQKKNIRTISDYVSDLSGVLDQAFSNRYGAQSARDSITSSFISIKEAADAAAESILDAKDAIASLTADRSVLEYQLKVAVKYGDTLRVQVITAKLAEVNKRLAEEQTKVAEAQELTNKTLKGNSKAGIENRSTVRDLIQSGNAYLMTLAQSGMSTELLKGKAAELTDEFLAQGTQLGFSRAELEEYTKYFLTDFTNVVNAVPKDITLSVNADPALAAIEDFVSRTNTLLSQINVYNPSTGISTGASGGATGGGTTTGGGATGSAATPTAAAAAALLQRRLAAADAAKLKTVTLQISKLQTQAVSEKNKLAAAQYVFWNVNSSQDQLNKVNGIEYGLGLISKSIGTLTSQKMALEQKIALKKADGGYISGAGTGTSDSIPAMLSNGEYVLKANAVKYYGTDFMNSLNQMQVQRPASYANSASGGSSVVYLSPEDRQLLRAAADRPIALYTENTKIAQSANAGNVMLAQRGTN